MTWLPHIRMSDSLHFSMGNRETFKRKLCFFEAQKNLKQKKEKMRRAAIKLTFSKVANFTLMQSRERVIFFLFFPLFVALLDHNSHAAPKCCTATE